MSDSALAALAVQHWKLCGAFARELEFTSADRVQAGEAQLRFARGRLEAILTEAGFRLVTYDGAPFTPEIPASPVNAEDVGPGAVVGTTIEPTITASGSVLIAGKILLKEV